MDLLQVNLVEGTTNQTTRVRPASFTTQKARYARPCRVNFVPSRRGEIFEQIGVRQLCRLETRLLCTWVVLIVHSAD